MRVIDTEQEAEWRAFAKRAATAFEADPKLSTYTDGHIEEDCLFAVRWGLDPANAVLVFRLAFEEPCVYPGMIKETL